MSNMLSMSKRAVRTATALALLAVMSVMAASLLMTGTGGATAFNTGASGDTTRHIPIPAQYTAQCSNGTAVPNPTRNPGLVADCAVLLAVKDTLEGTTGNLNWSADRAISGWDGFSLYNNRVGEFSLNRSMNLNGEIPAELGNLTGMTGLYIYFTQLTGEIPAELGNLTNLSLFGIHDNRITGEIPPELGNLVDLQELDLAKNRLTGEIPAELGKISRLGNLNLSDNQLTGDIPSELGNLPNLGSLNLSGNQLTGCIPRSLRGQLSYLSSSLPYCAAATATPTSTATSAATATPTPTPTATSAPRATDTPTATSVPGAPATPVATPTPTATSAASNDVTSRLVALERQVAEIPEIRKQVAEIPELKNQVAVLATRVAQLEGASAIASPSPIPTAIPSPTPSATPVIAPGVTPSPTATSVAGTSGGNACVTPLAGSASVTGSWSAACLSANPPTLDDYYARFYTFTLAAAARVTITLSSATAAPYLYLLDGAGTGGAVRLSDGDVATSVAITANLQPGAYTIEATTYYSQTPGDFTLDLEIR